MTDEKLIQTLRQGGFFMCKSGLFYVDALNSEAADRLEALMAENKLLKTQVPQWVRVKESLPENNERVLALCIDGIVHDMRWNYPSWGWHDLISGKAYCEEFATYWNPFPQLLGTDGEESEV